MIIRRLVSIPAIVLATLVLTTISPIALPLSLLISLVPASRGAFRTYLFALGYLWCEFFGLLSLLLVWIFIRSPERFLRANRRIQEIWATSLTTLGVKCYSLDIQVSGAECLSGDAAIVLPRHTSIAETVLPLVYYAIPQKFDLRYVMKQELLWDPCLDVAGNRIPNLFIDRHGPDSEHASQLIGDLTSTLGAREGLVFFPEGTRFTPLKRQRLLGSGKSIADMAKRYDDLLPPRLGGTLAILQANPGRDLIFLAHAGFEKSSQVINLLNGSWVKSNVQLRFWRVPYAQIPTDAPGQTLFIEQQWARMQVEVTALNS